MISPAAATSYIPLVSPAKGSFEEGTPLLGLVIPTLCESANLPALLHEVGCVLDSCGVSYEVIIVDDDSGDGVESVVCCAAEQNARIRLLVRKGERGLAGAIVHGWRNSRAPILAVMDGDGQHPASVLPTLLRAMEQGYELAVASRFARGSGLGEWHPIRCGISAIALLFSRPLWPGGLQVTDPLSGFFMIRRESLEGVSFCTKGFKLLLEILVRGRIHSVAEIPFTFGLRRGGRSKAGIAVAWQYAALLVTLYRERFLALLFRSRRGRRPIHFRLGAAEGARTGNSSPQERTPTPS